MIFPAYCSEKPLKLKTRHSNKKSLSIPCPLQYNEPPTQPRRITYKSSSVHRIDSPRWQHSFLKNWIRNEMKFLIESISSKQKVPNDKKRFFCGFHRWTSLLLNRVITTRNKKNRNPFPPKKVVKFIPREFSAINQNWSRPWKSLFRWNRSFRILLHYLSDLFLGWLCNRYNELFSLKVKHPCLS